VKRKNRIKNEIDDYLKNRGSPEKLASCGDKLFFILFYLKDYPLQEVLGFLFGLDQSQANRWIKVPSQVLKGALKRGDVIIDGAERPVHRPQDKEEQKEKYSGKKSPYGKKIWY